MTEERLSRSGDGARVKIAAGQQAASLQKRPTTRQLIFNIVLATLSLFAAAIMFSFGIRWADQGSVLAGVGLILAGLFIFWRGGNRVSWICAELRMRRQK
jgi:small-conductance mechanosensitive channel